MALLEKKQLSQTEDSCNTGRHAVSVLTLNHVSQLRDVTLTLYLQYLASYSSERLWFDSRLHLSLLIKSTHRFNVWTAKAHVS